MTFVPKATSVCVCVFLHLEVRFWKHFPKKQKTTICVNCLVFFYQITWFRAVVKRLISKSGFNNHMKEWAYIKFIIKNEHFNIRIMEIGLGVEIEEIFSTPFIYNATLPQLLLNQKCMLLSLSQSLVPVFSILFVKLWTSICNQRLCVLRPKPWNFQTSTKHYCTMSQLRGRNS